MIEEMGFPSYFLIVWDFVHYAKENGIAVGPGRGSAAGSIVSYSLGITDLDPVEHDLLLRALPQPRPQVDAGYRHRLLGSRPGPHDPVRDREVRLGLGRPDHHLRQDGPAGRDPRRGQGPRLRLRDRRPPRQADPGTDHGPLALLRGMPEGRARICGRPTTRMPTRRRSSTPPGASRARSATPRSTPPRWSSPAVR